MVRKQYNRFSLFCHFCSTLQDKKEDLRLIYLTETTVVKICISCLEVIDSAHNMKTEDLK